MQDCVINDNVLERIKEIRRILSVIDSCKGIGCDIVREEDGGFGKRKRKKTISKAKWD